MSQDFKGWIKVADNLLEIANGDAIELNDGQCDSLRALASRLQKNGVIIADEVGMGKTRIAAAVAKCVIAAGGRVAILVPPGLDDQWRKELRTADIEPPEILRSLDAYLNVWKEGGGKPWGECNAILLSHAFCNWKLKTNTKKNWRWALLPEVLALTIAKSRDSGRVPRGYRNNEKLSDLRVTNAAKWITKNSDQDLLGRLANEYVKQWSKTSPLFEPGSYTKNTDLRSDLEKVVGLGLGNFDLIIIDEAHKSRNDESNLTVLLENVICSSKVSRRLAITATPVELKPEQWNQMLSRIKVDTTFASKAIPVYINAIKKINECPNDSETLEAFKIAAKNFEKALSPYLLRRDKREDVWIQKFQEYSSEKELHAYRYKKEILVDTVGLSLAWKQTVCAAEALSFVTCLKDDAVAKRLRLTLANGHGLAALIDHQYRNDLDDKKQCEADGVAIASGTSDGEEITETDKRLKRAEWWQSVMKRSSEGAGSGNAALYKHPAILAAVDEIEKVSQLGEKVLVFGRFTRPLRALVELLNAREILRCIVSKQAWPQSKVLLPKMALAAAHLQLRRSGIFNIEDIKSQLAHQYKELEQQRRKIRGDLIEKIRQGMLEGGCSNLVKALFDVFDKETSKTECQNEAHSNDALTLVAHAIKEQIGPNIESASPRDFAMAFTDIVDVINATRDPDEDDADSELDGLKAEDLWRELVLGLDEEYNRPEGGFARLMVGETKPNTRHFLKSAFNRKYGYPKVLVAQSLVGREGLNLHKACCTVVLLHLEWNPGVVEQQIGRVDRIGSLWESKLKDAIDKNVAPNAIPRIEIRPIIFQGTYDEKNWEVLQKRWAELRAQLHGIVLTSGDKANHVDSDLIAKINALAPNFSPSINKIRVP